MKSTRLNLALTASLLSIFSGCAGEPNITTRCSNQCYTGLGLENGLGDCACTNTCSDIGDCVASESCTFASDLIGYVCVPIGDDCSQTNAVCFGFMSCINDGFSRYCSADCENDNDCPAGFVCDVVNRDGSTDKRCVTQ